ncbi:hypothetical protein ACWOB6_00820 [Falseniella ignava]
MAIDGVKIIDSDDAYDIYNTIVERYKNGENVDKIIEDILNDEDNFCIDDFYTEIYWTAFTYSLWKIGYLPEDIKNKTLQIIKKGADKFWLEIDSKALKQRQKALDKLAIQLQSVNPKPLKVPKANTKREPYFKAGDVLVVQFENEYGVGFVSDLDQSPRKVEYHLAFTRLLQKNKPTMTDFLNSEIACNMNNTKYALKTDCWFNHKDLGLLLDRFEKIGEIILEDYILGVLAPACALDDIYKEITASKGSRGLRFMETYKLIKDIK